MTVDYAIENRRNANRDMFGFFMQTYVMSVISTGATCRIGNYFKGVENENKSFLELRRALAHGTFNGTMAWPRAENLSTDFSPVSYFNRVVAIYLVNMLLRYLPN
jgi:hypothetical protein